MFRCSSICSCRGCTLCSNDSTGCIHIKLHILALQLPDAAECSFIKAGGQQHTLATCPDGHMGQHICRAACQNSSHILLKQGVSASHQHEALSDPSLGQKSLRSQQGCACFSSFPHKSLHMVNVQLLLYILQQGRAPVLLVSMLSGLYFDSGPCKQDGMTHNTKAAGQSLYCRKTTASLAWHLATIFSPQSTAKGTKDQQYTKLMTGKSSNNMDYLVLPVTSKATACMLLQVETALGS